MPFLKSKDHILYSRTKQIEEKAKRNGLRHAVFNSVKEKYVGQWEDDRKTGLGVIFARDYYKYEGHMKDNYRHGFGILSQHRNGKFIPLFRGEWYYGRMRGFGIHLYADDSCYQGYFRRGQRHGYGQMWYTDGSFYDGHWVNDKRQGLGIWLNCTGDKRYEGEWLNDAKHGKGRYFHIDIGQMQEGIWKDDRAKSNTLSDLPYRETAIRPSPYPILRVRIIKNNS